MFQRNTETGEGSFDKWEKVKQNNKNKSIIFALLNNIILCP